MELNFDKEIDALLRQTARSGEFLSVEAQKHLDADEISAFAENALPDKTKQFYMAHLADCDRCRKILSQTVLLNEETEIVAASPVVKNEIVETSVPWYRKIFALPNLAYAMCALVILLGGFIGLIVFQNATNMQSSSEISQIDQPQSSARGPNLGDEDFAFSESANANMSINASGNTAITSNASPVSAMNTNASAANADTATAASSINSSAKEKRGVAKPAPVEQQAEMQLDGAETNAKKDDDRVAADATLAEEAESGKGTPPGKPVQSAPPPAPRSEAQDSAKMRGKQENKALSENVLTRQISGKTFNRRDGVWYDAAYRNQKTTNFRRGTSEYRKLDSGVRSIAESLEGTVVLVWKEKAYRID